MNAYFLSRIAGRALRLKYAGYLKICPPSSALVIQARNCGMIRDWKPGPTPKTKEERDAAARKYNLIPEDYETFEEGTGYGDYPNLPIIGMDARDPYEDFDCHYLRRNFGEPWHVEYDATTSDRHNPNEVFKFSIYQMAMIFLGVLSSYCLISYIFIFYDWYFYYPCKPKQYPFVKPNGTKHYTFEPADKPSY